ncbi:magnesium and cobalt transport protein CorA [uncultured Amnibacterium sp.]|uniref:magnesium and cobalt transport protein CorA n=1 Tax=uncultured Amnibacterium sp. TaxID=1631851 RepID=UPI0035CA263D
MPIVDNAVYVEGRRTQDPSDLTETFELTRDRHGFAWVGLYRPTADELMAVATEFGLHPLAVEDATEGHQRPKIERYGDSRFVVLRPARYVDADERVDFGEVHVFLGVDFVIVVRKAESPDLSEVRRRLESEPALLAAGPYAVLYAIADRVVDDYVGVVNGLQNDIDEIEDQLFGGDPLVSKRIYELSREVLVFQRAIAPLSELITTVREDVGQDETKLEVRRAFRDVLDHVTQINSRVEAFRTLLQNALTVHATLVAQAQSEFTQNLTEASYRQGEQVKRVSSWAAIGFAPSLVAGVYGMNFNNMPELHWKLGYPFALTLMVGVGVLLYVLFKRRDWL